MGQKVNPISMRLQVNKDWRSKWFANKRDYATFLTQDLKTRRMIQDKVGSRGAINKVDIERSPNLVTVTITTAKAGVVIGRGGQGAQELKATIERIYKVPARVNIDEIKKPELYAKLVAENIAHQLERRISFRRAIWIRMPLAPARMVAPEELLMARRKLMRRSNWWAIFSATSLAYNSGFFISSMLTRAGTL